MMFLPASRNSPYSGSGSLTPGNRSEMIPSKRGTSGERNWREEREKENKALVVILYVDRTVLFYTHTLGKLTSMMDRSSSTFSSSLGYFSLRFPAATSTDLTALIP